MAFNPLNKVTKGLLIGATLAIATQGLLAPSVEAGTQAGYRTALPTLFSASTQKFAGVSSLLAYWAGGAVSGEAVPLDPPIVIYTKNKRQPTSSGGGGRAQLYPSPQIKVTKSKKNLYEKYQEKHIKQLMQEDEELIAIIITAINAGII